MPKLCLPPWIACLLLTATARAAAPAPARAIVEKAIQAEGGREKLARELGVHAKLRGTIHFLNGAAFTTDLYTYKQGQMKQVAEYDLQGTKRVLTLVLNGRDAWVAVDGQAQPLDEEALASTREEMYVAHVSSLLPLVKDKGFELSALRAGKVNGHAVAGVRVRSKGHPDVNLYFDRASGLLLKREYRARDARSEKEVSFVSLYSDYRELDPAGPERHTLKTAKVDDDGAALLDFLRKRSLAEKENEKIAALVRQLGDRSFRKREHASAELVARGQPAVPFLHEARKDPDPEIAHRARQCLRKIEPANDTEILTAVVRLVGLRKPAGAAEVLLAYVPFAPDEAVAAEVRAALAAVAVSNGKPDPVVTRALDDKNARRRAAAAEALGKTRPDRAVRRIFLAGIKQPMKIITYRGGEKSMEYELIEVTYFNKLDESVFARP